MLQFLVPHMVERESISNVPPSEEGDEGSVEDTQEQDFIIEQESIEQGNGEVERETESPENQAESVGNSSQPFQTSSQGSSATLIKKDKFVRPISAKPKIHRAAKPHESPSSQLMAYILAEKEAEKQTPRSAMEKAEHPVDAFLSGIAHSLKSLSPVLLHQAKGAIFSIVQEFELKQLMGYNSQGNSNQTQTNFTPFSPALSSSDSATTPYPSPVEDETSNRSESIFYQL